MLTAAGERTNQNQYQHVKANNTQNCQMQNSSKPLTLIFLL